MRFLRPGGMCKSGRCAQPRRLFPGPSGIVLRGGGRPGPSCFTRAQCLCPMRGSRGEDLGSRDVASACWFPLSFLATARLTWTCFLLALPRTNLFRVGRSTAHTKVLSLGAQPRCLSLSLSFSLKSLSGTLRLFVGGVVARAQKTISAAVSWAERKRLRGVRVSQVRSGQGRRR